MRTRAPPLWPDARSPGSRTRSVHTCWGLRTRLAMLPSAQSTASATRGWCFRGSIPSLCAPLSTLHQHPHGCQRMTRGQCGSLHLHWERLALSTPCRSPGARMVTFWVAVLATSILLYVLLDGFDLGVGMLFGLTRNEMRRRAMLSAVAPIWDGNETWLVVSGVVLWGAFPIGYAVLLSSFSLPVLVMLAGLILRGVAFEFRYKTERMRWIWDAGFAGGSLVAAFVQGLTVGALVEGLPIANGQYSGGEFGWVTSFW